MEEKFMKKRVLAVLLASAMVCSMAACGKKEKDSSGSEKKSISVTTTFAGEDGNAKNYQEACKAFTKDTGIEVKDSSATSDETFKARVTTDFETGSEPDVLFFFTGADASSFIKEEKVVSIDDIRKEYPEFADNMDCLLYTSIPCGNFYRNDYILYLQNDTLFPGRGAYELLLRKPGIPDIFYCFSLSGMI